MEGVINFFYAMSVMFIMFELLQVFCRKELQERMRMQEEKIQTAEKQNRGLRKNEYDKVLGQIFLWDLSYIAWSLLGLFSSQWVLFLLLLLLTGIPRMRISRVANSFLSIVLLVLIAINKFWPIIDLPRGLYELFFLS